MNRLLLVAISALVLSLPVSAKSFETVMVDTLNFESGLASVAVPPEDFLKIPFGKGPEQVGGDNEDTKHMTEGVPYTFLPIKDGSVWVLDSINQSVKRFDPKGALVTDIPFGKLHGDKPSIVRDFCPAPEDGAYLLCATDGKIERVDANGKLVLEIEGLRDAWSIGADPKGNVLVNHPAMNALLRFNPQGEILEKYDSMPDVGPFCDKDGKPYGMRAEESRVVLFKVTVASPAATVDLAEILLDLPKDRGAHFVSQKVLGTDSSENVYVEVTACDDDGVIHKSKLVRFDPSGKLLKQMDYRPIPFLSPDLPRHMVVTPDGEVMCFRVEEKNFVLCTYSF